MVEGVMQAYHMTLHEAMELTLPQVIMLNHAAWCNQKRAELRVNSDGANNRPEEIALHKGKDLTKCNSDEWGQYFTDFN